MSKLFIIGAGGFVGAVARYAVSGYFESWSKSVVFPFGTMAVNLLGCLMIGFVVALVDSAYTLSTELRTFILIGFLGAFTTFSTFGSETLNLMRDGEFFLALTNVTVNLVVGLALVWTGRVMVGWLWK